MADNQQHPEMPLASVRQEEKPAVRSRGKKRFLSEGFLLNVMGRTERALRMALGGALIMALTMYDIPTLHYSFKYVGPFLFFVVGTLAPPFLSSVMIVFLSGLFCILLACALATALVACLLITNGGRALCVVVYAVTIFFISFLSTGKTKEMTLIGSYIMLYPVPLATLVAAGYAYGGISLDITPERYLALRQFISNNTIEEIQAAVSHFLLVSPENVKGFLQAISTPAAINLVIGVLSNIIRIPLPKLPANRQVDPKNALNFFLNIAEKLPAGKEISFEMKLPRDAGLELSQSWMYDVPFFVEGVSGRTVTFGARPGTWFIKALWVASGPIGILRNLIIFAFLGFAVYILVLIMPPVRRQRDVAVRDMANACSVIHRCIRGSQMSLAESTGKTEKIENVEKDGHEENNIAENPEDEFELVAENKAMVVSPETAVDVLDTVVVNLVECEKAVLLSGMEPFLLYPGPGVFTMKHLEMVRKSLIQCCVQTQHMLRLFRNLKEKSTPDEDGKKGNYSNLFMAQSGVSLLAKSMEMYELCEQLLTAFPSIFSPSSYKKTCTELTTKMESVTKELRLLAAEITRPSDTDKEKIFEYLGHVAGDAAAGERNGWKEAMKENTESGDSFKHAIEILPKGLAITAFVQAGFSEPVQLSQRICDLSKAQQTNTRRGFLMNIIFPFIPVVVHIQRLLMGPISLFTFWRLNWKGRDAWWKNPEVWYAVKLVIPLICIFACGIFFPSFRQYSWGVELTDNPIFLDFSNQGVATRMAPWFLLGYLTVLQTTYNGTVHRSLARTVGILLGSFCAWGGLKWWGTNVTGVIIFSAITVFIDIFVFVDPVHPIDGFHRNWGYAGMVFSYTQVLVVTLALEELGGLTGARDYLTTTRILSNILGICLAVIMTHLPPLASATTASCDEYSKALSCCSDRLSALLCSFLRICGDQRVDDPLPAASVPADENKPSAKTAREELTSSISLLDSECKEHLSTASRLLKEGLYVPLLWPWRTPRILPKIQVASTSVFLEAQAAAQLLLSVCDEPTGQTPEGGEQELATVPFVSSSPQNSSSDIQQQPALTKRWSVSLMEQGNFVAIRQLFQTSKGSALRRAFLAMSGAVHNLAAAASAELRGSLPAFGDKLMCCRKSYVQQGAATDGIHQQTFESLRPAVESSGNRVTVALVECLGEHCAAYPEARPARIAAAFVVMKFLYHLRSIEFSLEEIHLALKNRNKKRGAGD